MNNSHDKKKSSLTIFERIIILLITATLIIFLVMVFLVVKTYWNLSFGWDSLELGILFIIIFIIALFLPTEEKKAGQ